MFNPAVKNNFSAIISNLAQSSASLQIMLNDRTSSLAHTMIHLDSFTNNLANNNQRITGTLDNLEKTTGKLANAKIDETLQSAQDAMNSLKDAINKVNSTEWNNGLVTERQKTLPEPGKHYAESEYFTGRPPHASETLCKHFCFRK